VTPQTLAPAQLSPARVGPLGGASGPAAPAGAEKLDITIGKVAVDGGFPDLARETAALAAGLEGKRLSVAQIYQFARTLEQLYANAGFVLVRVAVPPQRLKEGGAVKLVVIDGYIERIETKGVEERARAAVAARAEKLIGRTHVTLAEIERAILIAGDVPGLRLKSALAKGEKPGGALLVLEGEQRLVTGALGADNSLPDALGRWQGNVSLAINSALGFGEQAYVTLGSGFALAQYGFPNSPLKMIGGGVILPIGADGFTLNPEYTNSLTQPAAAAGAPKSIGDFQRWALRANFPLLRDRSETLNLTGALEYIHQDLFAPSFGTDINRDVYGALRIGGNWRILTPWSAPFQANLQISQGLGGLDAANAKAANIPSSRLGATPEFSKINADFRLNQSLPADFRLDLFGRAQASWGKPLFLSEGFALDGAEGLSAFSSGTFNVDTGATIRAELIHPFNVSQSSASMTLSPYLFAAQGRGWLFEPTSVQQAETIAAALGLGSRLAVEAPDGFTSATLGLEVGRQYSNLIGRRDATRFNLVASARF
jgi:hemolysin activation/secretion protein